MRPLPHLFLILVATLAARESLAADSAGAVDELKEGYRLKQEGRCTDALPHFHRSLELDPKPKAALNLAEGDCVLAEPACVVEAEHDLLARRTAQVRCVGDGDVLAVHREPQKSVRLKHGLAAPRAGTPPGR